MYENMQQAQGAGPQAAGPDMGGASYQEAPNQGGAADDVVDGDYREV